MASQTKDRLVDIGITLIVFIIATVVLGITNYQNNQQEVEVFYRQVDADIVIFDQNIANTVHLFRSAEDAEAAFPQFDAKINWSKEVALVYISYPQASSGYGLQLASGNQQGQTVTLKYKVTPPAPGRSYLTVITQPTLTIAVNRINLVSNGPLIFRFQDIDTNQTTSLTVLPDEVP